MERPEDYKSITELNISWRGLTELPSWVSECKKLKKLHCDSNNITRLDNLPQGLKKLCCQYNQITHLDNLPQKLKELYCYNNKITHLDYLPLSKLKVLVCVNNPLKYDFKPTLENIKNYINHNTKIN